MKWNKVEEILPKEGEKVLGYSWGRTYICTYPGDDPEGIYNEHWEVCEENDCACNGCTAAITHWMELPPPPNEEKKMKCWRCKDEELEE